MLYIIGFLAITQAFTLTWLFWLDQEYKAMNRYVQGLNGADKYTHPMKDEPGRFA